MSNPAALPVPLVTDIEAPIPAGVSAALIYEGDEPLLPQILAEVEARARGELDGVTAETAAGRKLLKSVPYRVTRAKVALDDLGKELVADLRAKVKSVDERRRDARTKLGAPKLELRDPLTQWDAEQARIAEEKARKERERLAGIEAAMTRLRDLAMPGENGAAAVSSCIAFLGSEPMEEEVFQERLHEAMALRDDLLRGLRKDLEIETLREEAEARAQAEKKAKDIAVAEEAERDRIREEQYAVELEKRIREREEMIRQKEAEEARLRAKAEAEREAREAAEAERAELARQLEEAQAEARRIKEAAEKHEGAGDITTEAARIAATFLTERDRQRIIETGPGDHEAITMPNPEEPTPEFEAASSLVVIADLDMAAAERVVTAIVGGEIPHVEWDV